MLELGPMLLAVTPAPGTEPPAIPPSVEIQNVLDFVMKGGPMMIPIGLCSLIAIAVIAERVISLRRGAVLPGDFLPGLKRLLDERPGDRDAALEYCAQRPSPVSNIFAAGIKRLNRPPEVIEKHIEEAGAREVTKLRKYLRALAVIASVAPLMGLLGTIFGMITAFQTVAISGEALGKTELLAKGIYEAMITTAAGLSVAIPVVIAYHWLSSKIDKLVHEMDVQSMDFVEECAGAGDGSDTGSVTGDEPPLKVAGTGT